MLKVKVFHFSEILISSFFESISFFSELEGNISLHFNHEPMKFNLTPGKIILKKDSEEILFFIGYGVASVNQNLVHIIGFPVLSDFASFENQCKALNGYGKKCQAEFGRPS